MIKCTITSVKNTTVYSDIKNIILPAFSGYMEILSGHAEAFVMLKKGEIILRSLNQADQNIKIDGGEFYFKDNVATIVL